MEGLGARRAMGADMASRGEYGGETATLPCEMEAFQVRGIEYQWFAA